MFVVDNSGSMGNNQQDLSDGAVELANKLSDPNKPVDWSAYITTTDGGNAGMPAGSLVTYGPDTESTFTGDLKVGTGGSGFEQCAAMAEKGLDWAKANISNDKFLRANAKLAIVCVSDEDDNSDANTDNNTTISQAYKDLIARLKNNYREDSADATFSSIVGEPGCTTAHEVGTRQIWAADNSGGLHRSLCGNFADALSDFTENVLNAPYCRDLPAIPDPETVSGTYNGEAISAHDYEIVIDTAKNNAQICGDALKQVGDYFFTGRKAGWSES